ncbi:MAG TPA: hypothetical protein DIC64_00485 [Alphaproteobacteria bacterium]|nr:hypothetical protein [Alphaproteobacteria bacterium]
MVENKIEIFLDLTGDVRDWVGLGLNEPKDWVGQNITLGVKMGKQLIAGIVFHDIRPRTDVWLTIFSTDKKWCNKRVLRAIFDIAFNFLECRRASVRVDAFNKKSRKLVEGLGFIKEGVLRRFEDNGNDGIIYSMLKNECVWRTKK